MTRPTKLTDDVAGRILEALSAGATVEAAVAAGPVSRSTYYGWLKRGRAARSGRYRDFVEDVDDAMAAAELALVQAWRSAAQDDWRAAAELLARRWPTRWARRSAIEVSGPEGGPVEITTEERARNLAAALRQHAVNVGHDVDDQADDDGPDDDGEPSAA